MIKPWMLAAATYLDETLAYQSRVETDGGKVISLSDVDALILSAKANGWWESAKGIYSGQYGVKRTPGSITISSATASSEYSATYSPDKAFDANMGTRWASTNTGFPHWVKWDYGVGNPKAIDRIQISPYAGPSATVKDFILEASNDDDEYALLLTGQHTSSAGAEIFGFVNSTSYRYYRLTINSTWETGGTGTSIYEITVLENNDTATRVATTLYDVTGNNFDLTATTSAPSIVFNVQNGRAAIRFASGKYCRSSAFNAGAQPNTIIAVAKQTSNPATPSAFIVDSAVGTRHILGYNGQYLAQYAGEAWKNSGDNSYNAVMILSGLYSGANSAMWKNGTSILSGQNPGTNSLANLWVGIADDSAAAPWVGDIYELIILHADATNKGAIETFLNSKWAVY